MNLCKIFAVSSVVLLTGCSTYIAPTPVESSKECWADVPQVEVSKNTQGLTEYRTCMSSASEAGLAFKLENKLERIGAKYCRQQGRHFQLLRTRSAYANFKDKARVELIFACTDNVDDATVPNRKARKKIERENKNKYEQLMQIQQLKESGALTQEEFEAEKAKVLKR